MQITTLSDNGMLPFAATTTTKNANGGWSKSGRGSRHRGKSKLMEQIDLFLEGMGLYRKQTARDASCLFRAVSEQVFYSQCFHYSVRLSCVQFMERNRHLFPAKIDGERFEDHARRLRSPREWGGQCEMQAMSLLYKRDFIVFNDITSPPVQVTDNNFQNKILLCRTGANHFDSVFRKTFIDHTAICQGLIYELLYGKVFGMEDIGTAVQVMLYEGKNSKDRGELTSTLRENYARPNSVINVLVKGGTPFPYKVAKALDHRMYRNVEYDLWNDERKELKKSSVFHNEILQVGSKCLVTIRGKEKHQYPAYIQNMQPDKGPVTVFVEVLGEMCTVPYDHIEPIVLPLPRTRCLLINGTQLAPATTPTVRLRRLKPSRMSEKATTLREIAEKLQNTIPKLPSAVDLNNNSTSTPNANNNNQTQLTPSPMIWSQNSMNSSNDILLSSSPESSSSRDTRSSFDSGISPTNSVSSSDQSYYVMSPSPTQPWGIYPPVPPCPPPQVQFPQSPVPPPQPAIQMPTPLYVTFSDGTTMLVPTTHRLPEPPHQQPPPAQMLYHYDPTGNPPAAPFAPQHFGVVETPEQALENLTMSLDHQLVLHQIENSYDSTMPPLNMLPLPQGSVGYWPPEQQQIPHHMLSGSGFCPPHHHMQQPQQPHCPPNPPPIVNGDLGPMTVFFTPPFPYPLSN